MAVLKIDQINKAIIAAKAPEEVLKIEAALEAKELLMRKSGLYDLVKLRPLNEARMRARWKLGQLLAKEMKVAGPGRGKKDSIDLNAFKYLIQRLKLTHQTANVAQQIGALPEAELLASFAETRMHDVLNTFADLVDRARPFWKIERRKMKHSAIASAADAIVLPNDFGPFPLIYADPPWSFATYTESGGGRSPSQHYPTMSLDEIVALEIGGKRVGELAHETAALFLWCTSSNIDQALAVMLGWGFVFKASAVWVKGVQGMGLIFRNMHEVLLYGSRGAMPGPVFVPPSVLNFARGEHSVKPPEIRQIIEKMFPQYQQQTRIELFARGHVEGWTTYGYESRQTAA